MTTDPDSNACEPTIAQLTCGFILSSLVCAPVLILTMLLQLQVANSLNLLNWHFNLFLPDTLYLALSYCLFGQILTFPVALGFGLIIQPSLAHFRIFSATGYGVSRGFGAVIPLQLIAYTYASSFHSDGDVTFENFSRGLYSFVVPSVLAGVAAALIFWLIVYGKGCLLSLSPSHRAE